MKLDRSLPNPFRRIVTGSLLLLLLMSPVTACVAGLNDITEEEKALTAPYCADTEAFGGKHQCSGGRTPKSHYWERVMGYGFCAVHHYCWAQIMVMRANGPGLSAEQRKRKFTYIIQEYDYVIRNSRSDFVLLPEIYTRLGEAELRINNPEKANAAFAMARKLKPDYWPAYSRWVDFLIKAGKRADAKALAKSGLENSPDAKVLIAQYQQLGGNPKDIEARPKIQESGETPAADN